MNVLLLFEISYSLRMREGAECRKPLATDEGGRFIILAARETNTIEYELDFYCDMSRQGYIRL